MREQNSGPNLAGYQGNSGPNPYLGAVRQETGSAIILDIAEVCGKELIRDTGYFSNQNWLGRQRRVGRISEAETGLRVTAGLRPENRFACCLPAYFHTIQYALFCALEHFLWHCRI